MSDTPRTDAEFEKAPRADYGGMTHMTVFARQLERELQITTTACNNVIQERDYLLRQNERLREALLYIKKQNERGYISYCGMPHEKVIDKALAAQPEEKTL